MSARSLWLIILAVIGLTFPGASVAGSDAHARTVSRLPAGDAVIIIAPAPISVKDQESEAYADWAEYLNAFYARKPKALMIVRMTQTRWKLLSGKAASVGDYATIFLRRDRVALLYKGMILEPEVYGYGSRWIYSRHISNVDFAGLSLIRIRASTRN